MTGSIVQCVSKDSGLVLADSEGQTLLMFDMLANACDDQALRVP